jgi:hypothetical protein
MTLLGLDVDVIAEVEQVLSYESDDDKSIVIGELTIGTVFEAEDKISVPESVPCGVEAEE